MKTLLITLLLAVNAVAGTYLTDPPADPAPTLLQIQAQRLEEHRYRFVPAYPWREIDGVRCVASGSNWVQFVGKVLQASHDGIRVRGWFGAPMSWMPNVKADLVRVKGSDIMVPLEREYFVTGFPFEAAEDDVISWDQSLVAFESGTYSYTTVTGASRTLHKLDFGKVVSAPPPAPMTEKQIDAKKKAKAETDQKAMERQKALAEKDDPYGLYRMGQRYMFGDGVEKDQVKGRMMLNKAAVLGSTEAKAYLEKLDSNIVTK